MKVASICVVILVGVSLFVGCSNESGDDLTGAPERVEGEPPSDLSARFNELVDRYKDSTLAVLYESEIFVRDTPEEVLFQKEGQRTRTDEVSLGEDVYLGVTTIKGDDIPRFRNYCVWSTPDGQAEMKVECTEFDGFVPALDLLLSKVSTIAFDGHWQLLGVRVDCFHINYENQATNEQFNSRLLPFGRICFSDDGVPLIVEANVHPLGQREYVAKEIRNLQPEWRLQVVDVGDAIAVGETKYFAPDDLRLPDTPLTQRIVESMEDETNAHEAPGQ